MDRVLISLFLCFGLLAALGHSQAPQPEGSNASFELQVGKMSYDVVEGKPFFITTPKGERLEVVLRRKESLQFNDAGISFNYPSALQVSTDKGSGVTTIKLDSVKSLLALIQVHAATTSADELRATFLEELRKEFKSRNAEFLESSGKPAKRRFGGIEREGQALEFLLAGARMTTEVYAFAKDKAVIAVVLQHAKDDADLASKYFTIITDSFK
jgi:hypothetical protein